MELNKVYNQDCLIGMQNIPDKSIDIIITSPPYNKAGYEGFIRKRHEKDSWSKGRNIEYNGDAEKDFMPENEYQSWQIKILNEFKRILKDDGSVFYNHKVRVAQHLGSHPMEWILKSKLVFRQQITWNRKNSPAVAPIRFLPNTELIFWLTKSATQPKFNRAKESLFIGEVWDISPKPNPLHPAPMPKEIPDNILMCIDNKDTVVLDPFAGIGTVILSAIENGFDYIGFEKEEKYYNIIQERIANHTKSEILPIKKKTIITQGQQNLF